MSLNELSTSIHDAAVAKGFWDGERNLGEMLMLVTSELTEALEEDRAGRTDHYYSAPFGDLPSGTVDHDVHGCPRCWFQGTHVAVKPEGVAVELVDALIRILDILGARDVNIDQLVSEKMAYNATRGHKHGKSY